MPLPAVLHEDDSLVAWDKPSGLLVAPDRWDKSRENLMALVHARFGSRVANVHRLDADTSGVLLCAKSKPALDFLSGQFQSKQAQKVYHALCVVLPPERAMKVVAPVRTAAGRLPAEFELDYALGPDEERPGRMRLFRRRGGKPSLTRVRVLEDFGRYAWLECRPLTGRTHQIRVHLAAAGAPILEDAFYGDREARLLLSDLKRRYKGRDDELPLIRRLALHASELTVAHPEDSRPCTIHSPLPREFEVALKYLRRFAFPQSGNGMVRGGRGLALGGGAPPEDLPQHGQGDGVDDGAPD